MYWHNIWLGPDQDIHFFYTRSHLSALKKCALMFPTNFEFIFTFKDALHNLVIALRITLKVFPKYLRLFIEITRSFVAIELLTFSKNAKFHF